MINFMNQLYMRLNIEIQKLSDKSTKKTHHAIKIIQIISMIAKKHEYLK